MERLQIGVKNPLITNSVEARKTSPRTCSTQPADHVPQELGYPAPESALYSNSTVVVSSALTRTSWESSPKTSCHA